MTGARAGCRTVRGWLQEMRDRGVDTCELVSFVAVEAWPGQAGGAGPWPPGVREHLRGCRRCREFGRVLGVLPEVLREGLDRSVGRGGLLPEPRLPSPVMRWGLVAAAALLAAGLTGAVAQRAITVRGVRGEVARFVEELYAEPLLADAESALRRSRGDLGAYLDTLGEEGLQWLQEGAAESLPD